MKFILLAVVLSCIYVSNGQKNCPLCPPKKVCGASCTFRMCDVDQNVKRKRILVRPANAGSFNPTICRNTNGGETLGFILKTGEAQVELSNGVTVPFSKYRNTPMGKVKPKFDKKFWTTQKVPIVGRSVIIRKVSKGNQEKFLDDLCIRLPVVKYQRLVGGKFKKAKTARLPTDCVAFSTRNAQLLIEVLWESNDDLDLEVTQPDNQKLYRGNARSSNRGRFSKDIVPDCGGRGFGRESVKYFADATIIPGKYLIQVKHFSNCGDGPTKWTLRASLNGKLRLLKTGTSNAFNNDVIISQMLTLP